MELMKLNHQNPLSVSNLNLYIGCQKVVCTKAKYPRMFKHHSNTYKYMYTSKELSVRKIYRICVYIRMYAICIYV